MASFVPVHQVEVRFSSLLDFGIVGKNILAPYVQMASNLIIENEGLTLKERITLSFDEEGYILIVSADRIVIRYQGIEIKHLSKGNSPIQSTYIEILDRIRKLDSFGIIKNLLFWTIVVDINDKEIDNKNNASAFAEKYMNAKLTKTFKEFDDYAIILDNVEKGNETSFTFGPYRGKQDLDKRQIQVANSFKDFVDKTGTMYEIKILKKSSEFDFGTYKKLMDNIFEYKERTKNI